MWKSLSRVVILVLSFVMYSTVVLAQCDEVPNPGSPDDPGYDPNGCYVPLDTWVALLAVVAFVYGFYHLYKNQKAATA